ncbi:MAG TPA: enoyl-CoA hydratase/isomerase family protein [Sporichthya sp.]|nr:enoyl-CoA hydratase/isomerase family protein [Sporichthya sp.]
MPKYLNVAVSDGVGILQFDHPEKRNALGWELHEGICDQLAAWAYDDEVACVLFIGNEDYFCSGWALDVLQDTGNRERTQFVELATKLMVAIYDYRKPTVAAVAGVAPGYGMDVANMCDVTIASDNAAFGSTQVKYAMNGFYHALERKVGAQNARRMYFTGDPITAAEALRIGLVSEVVPVGTLRENGLRVARQIAEAGPELLTVLKEVALRAGHMDPVAATNYELRVTADLVSRDLFTRRIEEGLERMRAGRSKATERLVR